MEKKINAAGIILTIVAVLLIGVFGFILYSDGKIFNSHDVLSEAPANDETTVSANVSKVQHSINSSLEKIVLYGDEYLGNSALANELQNVLDTELFLKLNNEIEKYPRIIGTHLQIPVANFEVHNESLNTIFVRIGIDPLIVARDFVMPADTSPVEISLQLINGSPLQLSTQSAVSLGTVTIDGVAGKLSRSRSSEAGCYNFTPKTAVGTEKTIVSGTKLSLELSDKYRDYMPVIFFGNNDFTNVQNFLSRCKSIVKHQTIQDKYIIICRTPANSELDTAMTENFGYNYIRVDDTIDYPDLAEKIYFRMKTLKYLDIITDSIKKAEKRIFPEG